MPLFDWLGWGSSTGAAAAKTTTIDTTEVLATLAEIKADAQKALEEALEKKAQQDATNLQASEKDASQNAQQGIKTQQKALAEAAMARRERMLAGEGKANPLQSKEMVAILAETARLGAIKAAEEAERAARLEAAAKAAEAEMAIKRGLAKEYVRQMGTENDAYTDSLIDRLRNDPAMLALVREEIVLEKQRLAAEQLAIEQENQRIAAEKAAIAEAAKSTIASTTAALLSGKQERASFVELLEQERIRKSLPTDPKQQANKWALFANDLRTDLKNQAKDGHTL